MNRRLLPLMISMVLVLLLVSACSTFLPTGDVLPAGDQQATQKALIEAAVASTATQMAVQATQTSMAIELAAMQAYLTEQAKPLVQTATVLAAQETAAPSATLTATSTGTLEPSPTPTVTFTPTLTLTPTLTTTPATPSVTALPCNEAKFEADVTIPDGTVLSPGTTFVKTWRLRNTGACTWTTSYDLVFVSGDRLGASEVIDMPANVINGQVIDLPVTMVAPAGSGSYRGNWKLRDASGILFGVGKTSSTFYVDIRVASQETSTGSFNFISRICEAQWSNASSSLPCPGAKDDSRGYAYRVDNPTLESGYKDDEPALLTVPQSTTDGIIRGKYPPFRVESGHHFTAVIGCAYESTGCDVTFRLDYQIGTGDVKVFKSWSEKYDKAFASVNVDLSSLAGNDVKFILTILANGSSSGDRGLWLQPKITK